MKKPIYVQWKVLLWENMEISNPFNPSQKRIAPMPEHGQAIMPVFFSKDELLKQYPGAEFFKGEIDDKEHG